MPPAGNDQIVPAFCGGDGRCGCRPTDTDSRGNANLGEIQFQQASHGEYQREMHANDDQCKQEQDRRDVDEQPDVRARANRREEHEHQHIARLAVAG